MKVKELIDILHNYDPETEIVTCYYQSEDTYCDGGYLFDVLHKNQITIGKESESRDRLHKVVGKLIIDLDS